MQHAKTTRNGLLPPPSPQSDATHGKTTYNREIAYALWEGLGLSLCIGWAGRNTLSPCLCWVGGVEIPQFLPLGSSSIGWVVVLVGW